ncbi:TPR repeat region, partial [Opisthorchis viverrini]
MGTMLRQLAPSRYSLTLFGRSVRATLLSRHHNLFSSGSGVVDEPDPNLTVLQHARFHELRRTESLENRKARLIYQSRKRGNLENGILLSTFVDEYIDKLTPDQVGSYDALINLADNDWDIYYWVTVETLHPKGSDQDVEFDAIRMTNVYKLYTSYGHLSTDFGCVDAREVPEVFRTDVFEMLRDHVKNKEKQLRNQQPPLKPRSQI